MMTTTALERLLLKFDRNEPASESAILDFETASGFQLPDDYRQFLLYSNGGEGFIGQHAYAMIWPIEQVVSMNEAYQTAEYAPGLLVFGSDGGGEAFAFDVREDYWSVVSVPFVGMDLKVAKSIASTFSEFLEELFHS